MLLDDLADVLTSGGVTASLIFKGTLLPAPDTAIALYESGGMPTEHTMGNSAGSAIAERPRVQVVSRAADYETARDNAHVAFQLLDGLPRRTVNGVRYLWCQAAQSPYLRGREDGSNRVLVEFSVDIIKELSTTS